MRIIDVDIECKYVERSPSHIDILSNKINILDNKLENVSSGIDEKADNERVDSIDLVIETILEEIIPNIVESEDIMEE